MVYNAFSETMKQKLQERLGTEYSVRIHKVSKNNGILLDGLSILPPGSMLAPTIYLNSYYEQYLQGVSADQLLDEILELVRQNPQPRDFTADDLNDLEPFRHKVLMKLVHADSNRALLSGIPYVEFLDLALIFYILLEKNGNGQMTLLIRNEHLKLWNIREKEVFQLALANTPLACPARIQSMHEAIRESARKNFGDHYNEEVLEGLLGEENDCAPLYVLSNTSGIYGACCILYRDLLKDFAESIHSDLVIIPSSIHEVLLTPLAEDTSLESLNIMVSDINESEVSPEDQLSSHVYLYTRASDRIEPFFSMEASPSAGS